MIIGIGYKKGSGKNTAAQIIRLQAIREYVKGDCIYEKGKTPIFDIREFSDYMKAMALEVFGPIQKEDTLPEPWPKITYREWLQQFGTDLVRANDPDFWIKCLFSKPAKHLIIPGVRFENECEAIKSRGGVLIRIDRPGLPQDTHSSENQLNNYTGWDYVIENDGDLGVFKRKVIALYKKIDNEYGISRN